jgi:hypothetical protein
MFTFIAPIEWSNDFSALHKKKKILNLSGGNIILKKTMLVAW